MIKFVIFDLDQTLVDSSCAEAERDNRNWANVYSKISEMYLFDGILDILEYLKENNIEYSIITNSPSNYCGKVINHFNLKPQFIISYHDVKKRKPNSEPMSLAMEKFHSTSTSEFLNIGDNKNDIIAAKNIGIKSIGVCWGIKDITNLAASNPDFLIKSPNEIIKIIQIINQESS